MIPGHLETVSNVQCLLYTLYGMVIGLDFAKISGHIFKDLLRPRASK